MAVGDQLGPYRLLAQLGAGGMGEVYRAKDLRLGREVAVKVLPEAFTRDPDRLARFEQEARAVAALSHPSIVVLFDFGTDRGIWYAAMELLEGETLRRCLARSPLPWRRAVELAAAIAEGLTAAHAKGIVHRDLKPENLFLTAGGGAKILDFGLARVEACAQDQAETRPYVPARTDAGTVMGTVGYMSPEQVRAMPVDSRSDIFSLGCVLYEMVTGRRAFACPTGAETMTAILHDTPVALTGSAKPFPPALAQVLLHCLEKVPEQRFPSARELAVALRTLLSGSDLPSPLKGPRGRQPRKSATAIDSIAVLPLINASTNADTEYLSDGITESLINLLSLLPGLRVMARSTVFRYKGHENDPQAAGRELNVRAVLTGRLLQRGNRLIIQAELVAVQDGSRLWGEQYDRPLADILAIEEEISKEITEKLRLRLTGEQRRRVGKRYRANIEAYHYYLKGQHYLNRRTEEGLRKGIGHFQQAIDSDPIYAAAYVGLADCYHNLGGWGHLPPREAYPKAKAAATRALAIDDLLAEAHASLAIITKEYDWDLPGAEAEYKKALQLNPNHAIARMWYGEYLAAVGRHEEAIGAIQQACEVDPLSLITNAALGRHGYFFARRYDEAIDQFRKTLDMDPNFWVAHHFLGWVYARKGQLAQAIAEFEAAKRLEANLEAVAGLGYVQGLSGRNQEARQALAEMDELSSRRYVSPMNRALVYAGLGESDQAFEWLDKAYNERSQWLSEIKADPAFDSLRSDARFPELLRRIGFQA
jgi:eukaryotic-like serine/threonine-protein kinase